MPTYWGRSHGFRRPGDSTEDHPTPANEPGTMARLLASLQNLAEKPSVVVILISSSAPDVATSAAWRVDTIRDLYPDLPIALWLPTHVQILHGRLRSLGHDDWTSWFDSRGYPLIRNMQLMVPFVLGMDLVVALDDDEVVEDPHFMRRAAEAFVRGDAGGDRVYGAGGHYLDEDGRRTHEVADDEKEQTNPFEQKTYLMNGILERIAATPGQVVRSAFALGGNMSFGRELMGRVGFDPSIARGEDIDYVLNAALAGIPYHFDKERPIRHLPPEGRSYKDFDYVKLQQDVRRFIYEREKLRAAARTEGLSRVRPQDLDPYPGAFLHDDLEAQAIDSLTLHKPKLFDTSIPQPDVFVQNALHFAHTAAVYYIAFAREWPRAMAEIADDRVLRHVIRGILP